MIKEKLVYETWDGRKFAEKYEAIGHILRQVEKDIINLQGGGSENYTIIAKEGRLSDIEEQAVAILHMIQYGDRK